MPNSEHAFRTWQAQHGLRCSEREQLRWQDGYCAAEAEARQREARHEQCLARQLGAALGVAYDAIGVLEAHDPLWAMALRSELDARLHGTEHWPTLDELRREYLAAK